MPIYGGCLFLLSVALFEPSESHVEDGDIFMPVPLCQALWMYSPIPTRLFEIALSVAVHTHKIGFELPPRLKLPGQ